MRSNSQTCSTTSIYTTCSASQTSREFTLALNLDILDAGRSPKPVRVHDGTTQVEFEVDRPQPADCPPLDLLSTLVKKAVVICKKSFEKK